MPRRWTFTDPDGVLAPYTLPINPNKADAPETVANVTPTPAILIGRPDSEQVPSSPPSQTWDGIFYNRRDRDNFAAWLDNGRPVLVTDHRGQQILVLIRSVSSTRAQSRQHPGKEKYTATVAVLEVVSL